MVGSATALRVTNEPNPEMAQCLCLVQDDIRVLTATHVRQVRQLLNREPSVEVVLTDVTLPDGSWYSVLRELVRQRFEVPLVVCARAYDQRLLSQVVGRGAYYVVTESQATEELSVVITQAIIRAQKNRSSWKTAADDRNNNSWAAGR